MLVSYPLTAISCRPLPVTPAADVWRSRGTQWRASPSSAYGSTNALRSRILATRSPSVRSGCGWREGARPRWKRSASIAGREGVKSPSSSRDPAAAHRPDILGQTRRSHD
jgi:hypothetical protein